MAVTDDWFTVGKIDQTTYAISEYGHWEKVHSYLLIGVKSAVLIDTGLGIGNLKAALNQLTSMPIKVITTHVHWDHIGGHGDFAEIYVHELEQDWLLRGIPGLSMEVIKKNLVKDVPLTILNQLNFKIEQYKLYQGKPTGVLQDNDVIDLGNRKLQIIHTPGHSPGHICIYEPERGYLFTGDLIYQGSLFAFYPTTDPVAFVDSVAKICSIKYVDKVLPGHYKLPLTQDFLGAVNEACQELQAKGLAKHGSGVHDYGDFKIHF